MKKIAIIMIALVALNSFPASNYVEVNATTKTHKVVQSAKRQAKTRKRINKKLVRKRLIAYGKRKGMSFDSKLTIKTSSWFPPTNIKYYNKSDNGSRPYRRNPSSEFSGDKLPTEFATRSVACFDKSKALKNNSELISAGKGDIRYLLNSFSNCVASDITFNVKLKGRFLYILYA